MINAIDSLEIFRQGDNGHTELEWSNKIQEKIVQFDFQCVRTDINNISELAKILNDLLQSLIQLADKQYLSMLYQLIGKTRDIHGGKGEYMLSYMMILTWYKYFPNLAKIAIKLFVCDPHNIIPWYNSQAPYGSWKDIKYFSKYVFDQTSDSNHPLIKHCIDIINKQLRDDDSVYCEFEKTNSTISLVSKWIPREGSNKFGFLYDSLCVNYFPEFINSAQTEISKSRAIKKCRAQYRMLCSKLNRHIDTVQIKQAGNRWADIDHSKTTSITMVKQKDAFLNLKKGGTNQRSGDIDRIICAENLNKFLESIVKNKKEIKGEHVGLETFSKHALGFVNNYYANSQWRDILNSQWRDNSNKKNANGLGNMIAMIDTSGSMRGDPICAAIALGCRVAEKSVLGKRIMTFSSEPAWINLDNCNTFTEMVDKIITNSNAGLNTDFYKALDMILIAIEEFNVPTKEVENMILAIFSDMQIDDNLNSLYNNDYYNPTPVQTHELRAKWNIMYDNIKTKYAETGIRLYGTPLNPPHILFWNLKKTNGFPNLTIQHNCSMMSGYDPSILNLFCDLGFDALKNLTPYEIFKRSIDVERYNIWKEIFLRNL
jgi:hypothetical protein